MKWSFKLLTVSGIGVYIHVTFLILVAAIFSEYFERGGMSLALPGTALVISVFVCVLLHEFGHALTARRFGVRTRDIVLLPIGGVARLERIPREPIQEFLITVAGPSVNLVIAAVLFLTLKALGLAITLDVDAVTAPPFGTEAFLRQLLGINIALVVFNLIPAFPMDGGRILRSLLAFRLSYARATGIAARVGQAFAVLLCFAAISSHQWLIVLVSVFVFLGATGEAASAQIQRLFQGICASAGVIADFKTLGPDDSLRLAVQRLLSGCQVDFPVVDGGKVLGILTRQQLVTALQERGPEALVRDIPLSEVSPVEASDPMFHAWEELSRQGVACLPVRDQGQISGWITSDNLAEVAMVRKALASNAEAHRNQSETD